MDDDNVERITAENVDTSVDTPIEDLEQPDLVIATFSDELTARAAFTALRDMQQDKQLLLADIAIVMRDDNNTLHITEPDDMAAPEGALYGGTIGAIVGVIAGPIGVAVGGALGAMIGGALSKTSDADMDDEWLKELGGDLLPGAGMVVVVVPGISASQVGAFLTGQGGKVVMQPVDSVLANRMGMPELREPLVEDPDPLAR
jgi:uncharacterized membrane protein